jgi:16S rRNA (cytosine1402-N4)-methyltransferase
MASAAEPVHAPVLLEEALEALAVRPDGTYVDGTYGRGGHARAVLARLGVEGRLVVVDRDPEAIEYARQELGSDPRVRIHHATFDSVAALVGEGSVDGVLLDLGVSSPQLDDASRGFSFLRDGPLDMRMDPGSGPSAADFLATAGEAEIATVIASLGEERFARRIAHAIVEARATAPVRTTAAFAALVAGAIPARLHERGKHPATRTFQALRIYVNDELGELARGLAAAEQLLKPGGRLAVVSFHSLEDRMVKRFLAERSGQVSRGSRHLPMAMSAPTASFELKSRRAITAMRSEISRNPRARSAKLRSAIRTMAPAIPFDAIKAGVLPEMHA